MNRSVQTTALAALTSGHLVEARRMVADALEEERDPVAHAELVRLQARLSMWSGPVVAGTAGEVVATAVGIVEQAPELAALMMCDAALLAAYSRRLPEAERLAQRALDMTGGRGLAGAVAATGLGITYGLTGRREQAAPLLARAGELLDGDTGIVESAELLQHCVLALMVQERYDDAMAAAAGFLTAARPLGAVGLLPLPLCLLAHAGWKAGRWEEARLAAAEALTLAGGTQEPALELYAEAMLALVAGGQGRAETCRTRVERVQALSDSTGVGMFRVTGQMALVHLALGLDQPQEALDALAEVDRLMGGQRRAGMLNWHADRLDVLARLGQLPEAQAVLAVLAEEAAGNRWESAALLRCRGQLEADHGRAVELLEASVQAFAWQPYEQARSRLRLAERLAQEGRPEAADHAAQAARAFAALRAHGWLAQAEALTAAPVITAVTAEPAPAALEVRLLGGFHVLRDGQPVPLAHGIGAQAVKFVALQGGRTSVDELVETLWPEAEPGVGRTRLRNVLARLRQESEVLVRDGDEVVLAPGSACDVDAFLEEAAAALAAPGPAGEALARRAVERYAGELLPADRYHDWTAGHRERLRTRYLQLLDRLTTDAGGRGDVDAALTWYERALDVEPHDEDRYVQMAHLLVAHGRTGPALRIVRRAQAMLERLGVPASASLEELARRVGA